MMNRISLPYIETTNAPLTSIDKGSRNTKKKLNKASSENTFNSKSKSKSQLDMTSQNNFSANLMFIMDQVKTDEMNL